MPVIIAIVAVVLVLGGVVYYANQSRIQENKMAEEKAMMEKEAMEQKENEAMMAGPLTITLDALNNSSEKGTAAFSEIDGKIKVVVSVSGAPRGISQPAHIHTGSCPNPGAVKYPLTNLTNGMSETVIDVPISKILSDLPLAVNVHKSAADAKTYVSCGNIPSEMMMEKGEDAMMEDGGDVGAMSSAGVSYYGEVLAENGNGVYLLDFNQSDYENAIANEKLVVLYFYANWCPICKAEFPLMQKAFNELDTDKVIGFRVNYNDNQTDNDEKNLAKQFGVAYQHTKVFVKNGKQVLKAPDSWDKARYLTEINKAFTQ